MTEKQSRGEFLSLMAAASATIAIAIDAMLPAFSAVREHFGLPATSSEVAGLITVFIAGLGVGQFIYGPLADRFGRKPVFLVGLLIYVVAGLATTVAPTLEGLLLGRFLWGIGAAGPRVVAQAMLRDRFQGDELARAMAVILTLFLIVPTLSPALGQLVLEFAPWRFTFAIGPVFGTLVLVWSLRASETLDVSKRRALDFHSIRRSFAEVLRTPSALWNTLALTMLSTAFLPYLSSSERMYGEIYGRGSQFFMWFAATAVAMAGITFLTSKLVAQRGSKRTLQLLLGLLISASMIQVCVSYLTGGVPNFAFFFISTTLMVSLNTALTPLLTSRALNDVGHLAGTAASTIGGIAFIGSAYLSPWIDGAIGDTVTPFAVGYLAFSLLAAIGALLGNRFAEKSGPEFKRE